MSLRAAIALTLFLTLPATASTSAPGTPPLTPVTPTSAVTTWGDTAIFIDPVGEQERYRPFGRPDIVILTQPHPDHLSISTMIGMLRRDTIVLAPQTVIDELPLMISNNVITPFEPGSVQVVEGITFTAAPNCTGETTLTGVTLEIANTRAHIALSTTGTPHLSAQPTVC
ncbi:MAG: hypothetical protein AAFQ36_05455 [Pseudomonadota bacterium]